jgi:hypothetical protein
MFASSPHPRPLSHGRGEHLRPYFAVPFGDMMIAGCFGLLAATAEVLPDWRNQFSGRCEAGADAASRRGMESR